MMLRSNPARALKDYSNRGSSTQTNGAETLDPCTSEHGNLCQRQNATGISTGQSGMGLGVTFANSTVSGGSVVRASILGLVFSLAAAVATLAA